MTPNVSVRLFTNDQYYLDRVFYSNIYRVNEIKSGGVVIDIGAHAGYFALNSVIRGASKVYCFEPNRSNFETLLDNLRPIKDSCQAHNFGVLFDSQFLKFEIPKFNENKYFDFANIPIADPASTSTEVSPVFKLDSILTDVVSENKIALLKINLGGDNECEVLKSSNYLNCIDSICGLTRATSSEMDLLISHLNVQGFKPVLINTLEDGETLFIFSKPESSVTFNI